MAVEDHPIIKGMTAFMLFFKWLEAVTCLWFLRLFTPFCIGWGLWDFWFYTQGDTSQERADDAAIRTTAGVMLALCWLFLARCKGPFTLNKNGILERWPWAKELAAQPTPAPTSSPKQYTSPAADRYR